MKYKNTIKKGFKSAHWPTAPTKQTYSLTNQFDLLDTADWFRWAVCQVRIRNGWSLRILDDWMTGSTYNLPPFWIGLSIKLATCSFPYSSYFIDTLTMVCHSHGVRIIVRKFSVPPPTDLRHFRVNEWILKCTKKHLIWQCK